jgi:predicted metal-dependent hydrolase
MTFTSNNHALPPCRSRLSLRAKHISLTIDHKGLEIILPRGVSFEQGLDFALSKQRWIKKHWLVFKKNRSQGTAPADNCTINLKAIDEIWQYHMKEEAGRHTLLLETGQRHHGITLGESAKEQEIFSALIVWLKGYALSIFRPWMHELSEKTGLHFQSLRVGNQSRLWGSCSPRHGISLNVKLLFLPKDVVKYVMIHELCHTVHANHSARFWRKVACFVPDYKEHNQFLRQAQCEMPGWLYA